MVAVICDDEAAYLPGCVASIRVADPQAQITVLDNNSAGISEALAQCDGAPKHIRFSPALALPALYNRVKDNVDSGLIIIAHADVVFPGDFFQNIPAQGSCDAWSATVVYVNRLSIYYGGIYLDIEKNDVFRNGMWRSVPPGYAPIVTCGECCIGVTREVLREHCFDEAYLNGYFMEEFFLRLASAGRNILADAGKVTHYFVEAHKQYLSLKTDHQRFVDTHTAIMRSSLYLSWQEGMRQKSARLEAENKEKENSIARMLQEISDINNANAGLEAGHKEKENSLRKELDDLELERSKHIDVIKKFQLVCDKQKEFIIELEANKRNISRKRKGG